jgi:hypothetical protein
MVETVLVGNRETREDLKFMIQYVFADPNGNYGYWWAADWPTVACTPTQSSSANSCASAVTT